MRYSIVIALIVFIVAWIIEDRAMMGFSLGVILTECLYNHDRITTYIARLIDRIAGYPDNK